MFPLEMHPPKASFWNIWLGKVWRKGHETLRRGLIPVLSGDAEHISKGIVNYRDTERKKARNQWETLHGINQSPANESDLSRKIHPDTEAIHAEVNSKISTRRRQHGRARNWEGSLRLCPKPTQRCVFRTKSATCSEANRPPIPAESATVPEQTGHPFWVSLN